MIRDSLAIVVVARRHTERLSNTLVALDQDNVPGTITVVNLSGEPLALSGVTVVDAPVELSLSHAVDRALQDSTAEAVWILRDDTRVRPGALAALASVLDTSPSVGIVGPKQLDAESPATIREMGESMTRRGFAVQLAERELDQAQYDRTSDVLAVGEAGMLVRRDVWTKLGGFDPALPAVDGALDFCYRARTAGWLVEVVPRAEIETAVSSSEALAGALSDTQVVVEESRSRAHRVLVYGSSGARLFVAWALMFGALVRGIGRFIRKQSHPFAELRGTMAAVVDGRAVRRSRRALRSVQTNSIDGTRLFVSSADLRNRRALERDERRAVIEASDETPRLPFGATALWWTGFATIAGLVLGNRLLGAEALAGGALVPMPSTGSDSLAAIGATWSDVAGGFTGVPDGFAAMMGALGALTWWNPNLVVVTLFVLAIPLSFVSGYVGAGALTTNSRAALVVGTAWAVLPTLHIALAEGRVTAVLAHIALPFFARAISGSTIVALGWGSLLGAVAWVSVPALAPIIIIAIGTRALTGHPGALAALLPALALEWPRLLDSVSNPVAYFADRGLPFPTTAPRGIGALTLWPAEPTIPFLPVDVATLVALAVVVACVVLAAFAVIVADNPRVGVLLLLGGTALFMWFALGSTPLAIADGSAVGLFPGPLYDVVWFGLVVGAAITVSSLRSASVVVAPLSLAVLTAVGVAPLTAPLMGTALVAPSTVRTLPAYVEADAATNPGGGTLILTPTTEGLRAEIQRDAGVTLLDWTAAAATRTSPTATEGAIAEIAANLIVESGFDVAAAVADQGIRFVLLEAKPTATEVSAIASHAGLTSVGATDRGILWRVEADVTPTPTDRRPDTLYRAIAGVVGLVALIAAIPTSLPRRRPIEDDLIPLTDEDDDEHS